MTGLLGPGDTATPAPAPPVDVDVRNATGRTGLATGVEKALQAGGFATVTTGNAATATRSQVRAQAGAQTAAGAIARALGGLPVVTSGTVPDGHVEVLLGRDYAGPGSPATAAATPSATPAPQITSGSGVPCVN